MALILIRGESNSKLLNAIADMERHSTADILKSNEKKSTEFADEHRYFDFD